MEWFRWERNPWGQEILIGLSWDLIWLAVTVGALLIAGHVVFYYCCWRRPHPKIITRTLLRRLPEKILRHSVASRLFHWVMAISVLTLLLTAFLPILGVKFPWVTAHWVAGFVLTAAIVFHIMHATFSKGLDLMWINSKDLTDGRFTIQQAFGFNQTFESKPGKNSFENKLFHHITALATLAAIITGLIMMAKIDTPWWNRNPYLLSDDAWGIIYIVHGAGSVALITLIMAHIYFAARPEKRWITLSMLRGWISRENYLAHYDEERWPIAEKNRADAVAPVASEAEG